MQDTLEEEDKVLLEHRCHLELGNILVLVVWPGPLSVEELGLVRLLEVVDRDSLLLAHMVLVLGEVSNSSWVHN